MMLKMFNGLRRKMDEYNNKFNKEKTQRRTKKELNNTTTEIKKIHYRNAVALLKLQERVIVFVWCFERLALRSKEGRGRSWG